MVNPSISEGRPRMGTSIRRTANRVSPHQMAKSGGQGGGGHRRSRHESPEQEVFGRPGEEGRYSRRTGPPAN